MSLIKKIGLFLSLIVCGFIAAGCKQNAEKSVDKVTVRIADINFGEISPRTMENVLSADPYDNNFRYSFSATKGDEIEPIDSNFGFEDPDDITYDELMNWSYVFETGVYDFTLDVYDDIDDISLANWKGESTPEVQTKIYSSTVRVDLTGSSPDFILQFTLSPVENSYALLTVLLSYGAEAYEKISEPRYKLYLKSEYEAADDPSELDNCYIDCVSEESQSGGVDYITTLLVPANTNFELVGEFDVFETDEETDTIPVFSKKLEPIYIEKILPGVNKTVNLYDSTYDSNYTYSVYVMMINPDDYKMYETSDGITECMVTDVTFYGDNFDNQEEGKPGKVKLYDINTGYGYLVLPMLKPFYNPSDSKYYNFHGWYFDKECTIPAFDSIYNNFDSLSSVDYMTNETYGLVLNKDIRGNVILYPKWKKEVNIYLGNEDVISVRYQENMSVRDFINYYKIEKSDVYDAVNAPENTITSSLTITGNEQTVLYADPNPMLDDLLDETYTLTLSAEYEVAPEIAYIKAELVAPENPNYSYGTITNWGYKYTFDKATADNYGLSESPKSLEFSSKGNFEFVYTGGASETEAVSGELYYIDSDGNNGYTISSLNDSFAPAIFNARTVQDANGGESTSFDSVYNPKIGFGKVDGNNIIYVAYNTYYSWMNKYVIKALNADEYDGQNLEEENIFWTVFEGDFDKDIKAITGDSLGNVYFATEEAIYKISNIGNLDSLDDAEKIDLTSFDYGKEITDMIVNGNGLYFIGNNLVLSSSEGYRSTGGLYKVDLTDFTLDLDFNGIGSVKEPMDFGNCYIQAPNPAHINDYFIGPYKFLALTPKKLYILEEGFEFIPVSGDGNGKYKHSSRVVSVNLEYKTLDVFQAAEYKINDFSGQVAVADKSNSSAYFDPEN